LTTKTTPLNKISGFFFFTGFVIEKIQYLPIMVVSTVVNILSQVSYMLGYATWFLASHFYPSEAPKKNEWFGFAQIKEQYLIASTLGFIASCFSVAALFVPVLLIPVSWLFLSGNILWTFGEYHKLHNPPKDDKDYSERYQSTYLNYVIATTGISAIGAIGITLAFIFPPIAVSVFIISTILTIGLMGLSLEIWLDFNFNDHKPTPVKTSHEQMTLTLGPKIASENTKSEVPYHNNILLQSPKITRLNESSECSGSTQTCLKS
jgi:hypothetical protein